ncbi:MAG: metal ABC transporter substrate-binding protein [Verrucomicrobiota bacterium]
MVLLLLLVLLVPWASQAQLRVVTLHPMMTDLAKQVGGEHAQVTPLMQPGENVHTFQPSSSDMSLASQADVLLASGKGLELYLPRLRDTLGDTLVILEAGSAARSIRVSSSSAAFACCPHHAEGSLDPHWWHSIEAMKKATHYIAKEFAKLAPEHGPSFLANAEAWQQELTELERWTKREISAIPRERRYLVTAHAAFGYFCRDYGLQSIPVAGLSKETISSKYYSEALETIRKHQVRTVFPEKNTDPRILDSLIEAAGLTRGQALIADASVEGVTSYIAFMRHNVNAIVAGLTGS